MLDTPHNWPLTIVTSFSLIGLAEIGDKSQLVCMTLATRHRALPVIAGASLAFAGLNLAAVLFGAAVARWLPDTLIALVVGLLFLAFGLHALRGAGQEKEDCAPVKLAARGVFLSTLLLIALAEFGDKTQLAVASLSSSANPWAVWIGATLALTATSAAGVLAGRTLLKRIPVSLMQRISGTLFLLLAVVSFLRAAV